VAPVRDVSQAAGDPSVHASYYEPLIAELRRRSRGLPARVEIPPTQNRGEANYVAQEFPLARGWLRQLESDDFDLFTDGNLTPATYRLWLAQQGVSYVALSNAEHDYLSTDEVALIRGGLPYLRPVWSNGDWRLFRVKDAAGLVSTTGDFPAPTGRRDRIVALDPAGFTFAARDSGLFLVRIHYTRYWEVTAGDACVQSDGEWTGVDVRRPGVVRIAARFSLDALFGRDRQCSA
jgi:hypothetical protein